MKIPFTHYEVDVKSVFKKKCPVIDDHFGVYFICGRQGSGKSYLAVQFLNNLNLKHVSIYTNIHSLTLPHTNFTKIDEIKDNVEEHTCFVIDEISKKYPKNCPTDRDFYAWLNQSRKRKRVVILITQEWRELPMWIRRPAKIMIQSKPTKILGYFGFNTQCWGDAENMFFDKDEGEYICPPLKYVIHKKNMSIAKLYDTFEPVLDL